MSLGALTGSKMTINLRWIQDFGKEKAGEGLLPCTPKNVNNFAYMISKSLPGSKIKFFPEFVTSITILVFF